MGVRAMYDILKNIIVYKLIFRKQIWVFGSYNGTSFFHNSKALFLYVNQHCKQDIIPIWITKDINVMNNIRVNNMRCYTKTSIIGMIYCQIAKYHIFDWGLSNINHLLSRGVKQVNLWHGIPLKRIEKDILTEPTYSHIRTREYATLYYKKHFGIPSFMFACSEYDKQKLSSAFNVPIENIHITGMARNDWLFNKIQPTKQDVCNIEMVHNVVSKFTKSILFLPTFRDTQNYNVFEWIDDDAVKFFEDNNIAMYCKKHVADTCTNVVTESNNIKFFEHDMDLYPLLHLFDCLVTDYSSIYFDFALTGKQIIHFAPDLEEYKNNIRGMYIDLMQNLGGTFCTNVEDLQEAILVNTNHSKDIVKRYHTHSKGGYCENIVNVLKNDKI